MVRFVDDPAEAIQGVQRSARVMVGGFGLSGHPQRLLAALEREGVATNLTTISNNLGEPGHGLGSLLRRGFIRCAIGSYFTSNPDVAEAVKREDLEVTLLPQGDMAEAIRAGGVGIPAFYSPSRAGTELADRCETRTFNGREYVLQQALQADVALIKAYAADVHGNLIYRGAARNFNGAMARAARHTIVEVERIVDKLEPDSIVTPHIFVDVILNPSLDHG